MMEILTQAITQSTLGISDFLSGVAFGLGLWALIAFVRYLRKTPPHTAAK